MPEEIGARYSLFGKLLLEDDTGTLIGSIAGKHSDEKKINVEIFEQWIAGRGKHPVNWKTLAKVLYDIELSTLAEEIVTVKNVQIGKHSREFFYIALNTMFASLVPRFSVGGPQRACMSIYKANICI